jgi:predicted dehydrogenase
MGRRRLRNLRHLGGHDLAGVELQDARRAAVAEEHGIEAFDGFEAALGWRPDAAVISTPPDRHLEPALFAARNGLHFFVEASVVPEDTSELIATVRERGIVGAPSCTMRFHPAVRTIRRRLAEDAIGRVLTFAHHMGQYLPDWHPWEDYRTFYVARRATGAAREMVPFELSWLTYLFGGVTEIGGFRDKLSDLEADIDDVYATTVSFEGGVRGSMLLEVLSRPGIRHARLVGERGTLIWDWNDHCVREWTADAGEWTRYDDPPPVEGPGGTWVAENMYIDEMAAFIAAAGGGDPFPHTLEADRRLLGVLEAIESASDRGVAIRL